MNGTGGAWARAITLLVTNVTKLTGLVLTVHEILLRSTVRTSVLAVCGFMMAGAQLSEGAILAVIDRFLGSGGVHPEPEPPPNRRRKPRES